jgi:hypothetical protein
MPAHFPHPCKAVDLSPREFVSHARAWILAAKWSQQTTANILTDCAGKQFEDRSRLAGRECFHAESLQSGNVSDKSTLDIPAARCILESSAGSRRWPQLDSLLPPHSPARTGKCWRFFHAHTAPIAEPACDSTLRGSQSRRGRHRAPASMKVLYPPRGQLKRESNGSRESRPSQPAPQWSLMGAWKANQH